MMRTYLLCLGILATASLFAADTNPPPYPPAPGHEKLPVIFWAHYMTVVGTTEIDQNMHSRGASDVFPFVTVGPDSEEQHIRYALESGINGFQMFQGCPPSMKAAAEKIFAETGQRFYLNTQWGDEVGKDFDTAVHRIGTYASAHRDDPHIFRVDGKQVHFFYHGTGWAGKDQELFPKAKEIIKEKFGVEVLFVPFDNYMSDRLLLDRPELKLGNWPFLEKPQPGPPQWLQETTWDGITSWGPQDTPWQLAQMLRDRLQAGPNQNFLYMPQIVPGYDSSNRVWQHIHGPAHGMKVFRDNVRNWVRLGFRQLSVITWNDMTETMILPSTRSPFGFAQIGRYYHQLAVDGTSPFSEPKVVVSYDPETMYGDELYFQFLIIPETDPVESDYICNVRFEDQNGEEVASLTTRANVPDQQTDALTETRLDTTHLAGNVEVLSPVVSVYRTERHNHGRKTLFSALRLAPITLRYNQIQFFTPYVIALDRVAETLSLSLSHGQSPSRDVEMQTGEFLPLHVAYSGKEPLRRITLAEGRLNRGAFRADDQLATDSMKLFLRIRSEHDFEGTLTLTPGSILEVTNSRRGVTPVAAGGCEFKLSGGLANPVAHYDTPEKPVFRLEAAPDATLRLIPKGSAEPIVETTIAALAAGPLTLQKIVNEQPATIRLELSVDAMEFNQDYPLPESGEQVRHLNVDRYHDATRYFHAWGLTESDQIAYSRPLVLRRIPKDSEHAVIADGRTLVPGPLIRTRGILDDFVNPYSSASANPFEFSDVGLVKVEARQVPYILLDCDEGTGSLLNNGGTGHQIGSSWLQGGQGGYEWLKDGWSGSALRLKNGGSIKLRSKSFPPGAYTFSARTRVDSAATTDAPVAGEGDHYQGITTEGLRIDLLPDGRVKARRDICWGSIAGEAISNDSLSPGWNHLCVTHDLRSIRIFLNGKLSAEEPVSKPGYQRTHSAPTIGFSGVAKTKQGENAPAFTGDIDQIEIIGTALDANAVKVLYDKGQWMAQ
jgi:hypothetical protein